MDKPAPNRSLLPAGHLPIRIGVAALLLALVLLVFYLLLPLLARHLVLPRLFRAAGIQEYAVSVQRLSLFGLNAGPLRIGPEEAPGIYVASLSATYTPHGLLQQRIERITLAGVRILVRAGDKGRLVLPGLVLPEAPAQAGAEKTLTLPPVAIGTVHVPAGTIVIERGERRLELPFNVLATPENDMSAVSAVLELKLDDRWMTMNARADLAANRIAADWNADGLRIGRLARLAGLAQPPVLTGSGRLRGRLQGRLSPFAIQDLDATFGHTPCRLYWNATRLDVSGETTGEDITVHVRSTDIAHWTFETAPVRVHLPVGAEGRFALTGALDHTKAGGLEWQGRLDALLTADPIRADLPGVAMPLALTTAARIGADGRWQAGVKQTSGGASETASADVSASEAIRLEPTHFEVSAEGAGRTISADLSWRLADVAVAAAGLQVAIGAAEGSGHYQLRDDAAGEGRLDLTLSPVTVDDGRLKTRLKRLSIEAEGTIAPAVPIQLAGRLRVSGGTVRMAEPMLAADSISAHLPLAWPPPAKGQPGEFALASLAWEGRTLGAVRGKIQQNARGLRFTVRHDNRLLPGLKVSAEGAAGLAADGGRPFARVRWTAERPSQAPPLKISALMPNPPEVPITFDGRLFARGEMTYHKGLAGSLTAGMEGGRLQVDDKGMVIDGLATSVHIPDIGYVRSAPAQALTFDTVSFGTLRVEDGRLDYQLEPEGVFFLEGGRFRWCGGSVIAPASRFHPGENRYALTVFCDRLKLDMLLEQLGLARAEGGGAISGIIPVALENGLVTFNNAFLYSTPGEGGVIRVQGSEVLTAGIPPDTPQYNQMELARHALKDYDYDWARITMNTEAENLLVQLQFDGKPAEALPFVYDPGAGGFVKTDPGQPGSVFQGIRLDVNVSLPLNRMLRYRELFKRLQ